jgi:hypothetical protein
MKDKIKKGNQLTTKTKVKQKIIRQKFVLGKTTDK